LKPQVENVSNKSFFFLSLKFELIQVVWNCFCIECFCGKVKVRWVNKLEFVAQTPLKVKTRCTSLHPTFPNVQVVEGIANVSKDSKSNVILGLPLFYIKGEQMVTMTWVLHPNIPIMRYESNHLPSVTNVSDACNEASVERYVFCGNVNTSCHRRSLK
jgi:hypothetical protein